MDDGAKCIWHGDGVTDEDRSLIAQRGGLTKLRVLPETTPKPELATVGGIRKELRELIHAVKTGALAVKPTLAESNHADLASAK